MAASSKSSKPKRLAGGNPQIAKSDGDAPVQDYIAAMPGWKRKVGRRLDELITRAVPRVHNAKEARWIDLRDAAFDEAQFVEWVKQAAAIPGWGKS